MTMAASAELGNEKIYKEICSLLDSQSISFKRLEHQPTFTSEESARVRGEELSTGGKAILMKVDDSFKLFVLSASKKLNSKKIKEHFKSKKIRFATSDELKDLTQLVPGSVPPFGKNILPFDLYLDESIRQNEKIAFNAGLLTRSVVMSMKDYLDVAKPIELFDFSE